eukprot:178454_1
MYRQRNIKKSITDNDKQYCSTVEILSKHCCNDSIPSLIMTFVSSKQIHLFAGLLRNDNTIVELFAVSTFSDEILFKMRSSLPASFTKKKQTSWAYDIKITNNNTIWLHFTDESMKSMTHYIMKGQLLGSSLKCVNWKVYESETPSDRGRYDEIKSALTGNYGYSFGLFTKNEYLRFTEHYIHRFNTSKQQTEVICEWNHPYFEILLDNEFDFNPLESLVKSHSYEDIQFLYDVDDDEKVLDALVVSILYNEAPNHRLDLIEIIYDDHSSKSRKQTIHFESLLMAIYGLKKVIIHGYFIDTHHQNIVLVVNSCDVLIIDKNLKLLRRETLGFEVHKQYVCRLQRALNGNDWLFAVNHLCDYDEGECEKCLELLLVDGRTFQLVKKSKLLSWDWSYMDRIPCDLSHLTDVHPFLYST